jgi:hypothetical protein
MPVEAKGGGKDVPAISARPLLRYAEQTSSLLSLHSQLALAKSVAEDVQSSPTFAVLKSPMEYCILRPGNEVYVSTV